MKEEIKERMEYLKESLKSPYISLDTRSIIEGHIRLLEDIYEALNLF